MSSQSLHLCVARAAVIGMAMAGSITAHAQTCYVSTAGNAANSGINWSMPTDLATALARPNCPVVHVAAGVYVPTGVDAMAGFPLRPGVEIYGGYEGIPGGEGNVDARNPRLYKTILSGDVGGDDNVDAQGITADFTDIVGENASLFRLDSEQIWLADTVIDGVVVTGGVMSIQCLAPSAAVECSMTLRNIDFVGNRQALLATANAGGRVAPHVSMSTFRHNGLPNSSESGGAVRIISSGGGSIRPTFENVTFANNRAGIGGAMYATAADGVVDVTMSQVTFAGNSAVNRGGALALEGMSGSVYRLTNAIIWGNAAPSGAQLYTLGDNFASLHSTIVQGGCVTNMRCAAVTATDPLLGPLQDNGGYTLTLLPATGGGAVDTAHLSYCTPLDQRGIARPIGAGCDRGAVESTDPVFKAGFEP